MEITDFLSPAFIKAVGDLPVVSLCLIVIYAQFILLYFSAREMRRDLRDVVGVLTQVVTRLDAMNEHKLRR